MMSALELRVSVEEYLEQRREAIEALRKGPPQKGKWSKLFRVAIPSENGEMEYKDARFCIVLMNSWGHGYTATIGVFVDEYKRADGGTKKLYTSFDWHTGAILEHSCRSRKVALDEAIIKLQIHGSDEYHRRVEELNRVRNGKHLG